MIPAENAVAEPVFEFRDVAQTFESGSVGRRRVVHAVREFDLTLTPGESVGLVGESGSGKSTVARLAARLMAPTGGRLLLQGQDVLARRSRGVPSSYRRAVQMVFQDPFSSLNPTHTIGYHLNRALRIHGTPRRELAASRAALLEQVGLSSIARVDERYPYELSGGQRQRVAIARALAARPLLLIADEPTSMLDVSVRVGVLNLLGNLCRDERIATLLITHDLGSARYSTASLNVMYRGYIVESGPTSEIIDRPDHPYTRLLISSVPRRNKSATPGGVDVVGAAAEESGCPFFSRCPLRMAVCKTVMPERTPTGNGRWVRCHAVAPDQAAT